MTQEQLVKDLEDKFDYTITKSAISQYENDKRLPEINFLFIISKYFDVSIDYLLGKQTTQTTVINEKTLEEYFYDCEKRNIEISDILNVFIEKLDSANIVTLDGKQTDTKLVQLIKDGLEVVLGIARKKQI